MRLMSFSGLFHGRFTQNYASTARRDSGAFFAGLQKVKGGETEVEGSNEGQEPIGRIAVPSGRMLVTNGSYREWIDREVSIEKPTSQS